MGESDDAAGLEAERPDIDQRRLDAERREGRADLAPVVGSVVDRLGEPDTDRGIPLVALLIARPSPTASGSGPGRAAPIHVRLVGLHLGPSAPPRPRAVRVDLSSGIAGQVR